MGTGKDFTLFALRDGEVHFKVGANKKKFVTVVDAVNRSGRADGQPTRKDKRAAMYSPRAVIRAAAEEGIALTALHAADRSLEGVFDRLVQLHRGIGSTRGPTVPQAPGEAGR